MTEMPTKPQVVFHSNTDIDPRSWSVVGMNAKPDNGSPIGYFGSGLKYSLAILLRSGHEVEIFSNGKHYVFGLVKTDFRGKEFEQVTCNGEPLPYTTEYGKNWEIEGAYRELVSNTMDEGGIHFAGEPMDEGTSIVVRGEEFAKMLARHEELFIGDREPIAKGSVVSILEGNGTIFYRGVKVGTLPHAGFSYEIHESIRLTEDRTVSNIYDIHYKVMNYICTKLKDKALIRRILMLPKGKWEHADERDYDWQWSPEFSEVVKEIWETNPAILPKKVQNQIRTKLPDVEFKSIETEDHLMAIEHAKEFLAKAGYPVTGEILVVQNEDTNTVAFVHNGQIHLTERSFEKGLFDLVTTLFEEQMHIIGYSDCTRTFQQFLIDQLITQTRKRLKIVL
jgi:hypothetical protein